MCIVSFVMMSCNQISPEAKTAFIGEYWMETKPVEMCGDQVIYEFEHARWSPVSIYEENGKLWVRTNWFGAPYLSDDAEHAKVVEEYRDRPDFLPRKSQKDEIDSVTVTNGKPIVILQNGLMYTVRNGAYWQSEPIEVKSGSSTVLELREFTPVDVTVTNFDGTYLATVPVKYTYGPIVKNDEELSWQVELDLSQMPESLNGANVDRVVHRNILYKR